MSGYSPDLKRLFSQRITGAHAMSLLELHIDIVLQYAIYSHLK